jgi:hypothetical protein
LVDGSCRARRPLPPPRLRWRASGAGELPALPPCAPRPLWQPAQQNTVLSPKTDPLWPLSNSKVSSCR